ncbi:MAG TPA: acyl-CoA dehydrogenase family protein, partial [Candidatus Dormibacteraeota bacterium]|nr:acyl-CoA dehydrogenase family protein [Candidatus Dormibacteraeota bacterium]
MSWEFSTEPEFEKKLEWMRRFMHDEVYPLEVLDTNERGFMSAVRPLQDEVKRQKLWATHLPPELGGQGYGQVKLGLMHEIEGASIWGPIVFGNQAPDSGNSEILAEFGTEEQKRRWLHPLLDGKIRSAFSMTEPDTAGSDPTLLKSTAELDGDEWVINGHKWFSSNGMIADFLIAMVVTEPKADAYERASMIIVPTDVPGLKRLRNIPTMGGENERFGYGHAEIVYENVRVPATNVLGERGQGFLIAQARLGPGRIHHCMRWLGQARRAFDMLCERALQREAFGKKLASHETVQNWIADSAAEMQAARLMTLHAAWVIDTQGASAARKEISLIKFFGAKVLHDVIDRAIQVHGSL